MKPVVVGFVGKASCDHHYMLGRVLTNSFLYCLVIYNTYKVLILLLEIDMKTL